MRVVRDLSMVHPVLVADIARIQKEVIDAHNMPFRLFETGRFHDRQQALLNKGRTKDPLSRHLFDLSNEPKRYCTAVDYVYYDGKWSWNLRDTTIAHWYLLFGNLVLDACNTLEWGGNSRSNVNYTHFQLRRDAIIHNITEVQCAVP